MSNIGDYNTFDPNALSALKRATRDKSPEAVKEVAKQFESLFLQMVLKSMRDASKGEEGLFDSDSTRFYQGLHDQQMAGLLSQRGGIGLAKALERQLGGTQGAVTPDALSGQSTSMPGSFSLDKQYARNIAPASPAETPRVPTYVAPVVTPTAPRMSSSNPAAQQFAEKIWSQASGAAEQLGVPTRFLIGQAALETGWGKHEIRTADGRPSHNLFNIKAGKGWTGEVVEKRTVEYIDGKPQQRVERFRAYASYQESFDDYARLIGESPRYAAVVGKQDAQAFGQALQSGGYATDPAYASKLARVIDGSTVRRTSLAMGAG